MLSVVVLNSVMMNVANKPFMLNVVMLNVIMLSGVMLSVVAPYGHATMIKLSKQK